MYCGYLEKEPMFCENQNQAVATPSRKSLPPAWVCVGNRIAGG